MDAGSSGGGRFDVSGLATTALVLTFLLMLLGIYTAAVGAGLSCAQRWPLCDGAVFGLFPANWPSFVEWFHRLVAMITGFVILGTAVAAWRQGADTRIRAVTIVAAVFLPAQVILGALTVTEYTLVILAAHFGTAMVIFAALVLATVWSNTAGDIPRETRGRIRTGTLLALAVTALLTPRLFVEYGATMQVVYYAVGMAAFAGLLALAVAARGRRPRTASATTVGAAILFVELSIGRRVFGGTVQVVLFVGALLAGALLLVATRAEKL